MYIKMAIAKLSKSKKALLFVADEGTVYITSLMYMTGLLQNPDKFKLVLFNKFPLKASTDRFKQSPIFDPNGLALRAKEGTTTTDDVFSPKEVKTREQVVGYLDKEIDW
jgi:hypothetical protein